MATWSGSWSLTRKPFAVHCLVVSGPSPVLCHPRMALDREMASPSEEVAVVADRVKLGLKFRAVGVQNALYPLRAELGEQAGHKLRPPVGWWAPQAPRQLGTWLLPDTTGAGCSPHEGLWACWFPGPPGVPTCEWALAGLSSRAAVHRGLWEPASCLGNACSVGSVAGLRSISPRPCQRGPALKDVRRGKPGRRSWKNVKVLPSPRSYVTRVISIAVTAFLCTNACLRMM